MAQWKLLVGSRDFWVDWKKLKEDYADVKLLINYIENEWLSYKEEVFNFFMGKVMHFSVKVTSSNEGAHAVLKRFLNDRTGNLLTVCKATHNHITLQARKVEQKLAHSYYTTYIDLRHPLLRPLHQFTTPEALRLISKQIQALEKGTLRPCTGLFEQ